MSNKHLVMASVAKAAPHYMESSHEAIYRQLAEDGHIRPDGGAHTGNEAHPSRQVTDFDRPRKE
jgi:hypothetical protein